MNRPKDAGASMAEHAPSEPIPKMEKLMSGRRWLRSACIVAAIAIGGCSSSAPASPFAAPSSPVSSSSAPAATASSGASASAAASASPAIGQLADDGARVVKVDTVDARTRDLTIDSPAVGLKTVRLLLPAGFDAKPAKTWPVLYLLHGATDSHEGWTQNSDVEKFTATTDLLVVMPDGGDWGWYSDWWNQGAGGPPMWETFHIVELRQLIERNWHAGQKHIIAGLSMGGMGAMIYAARNPKMFLAAASFSGVLDTVGGQAHTDSTGTWGDPVAQADVWEAHNPLAQAESLKGLSLFVSYGNGQAGPFDSGVVPTGDLESWIASQNTTFVDRLKALGIPATVDAYGPGTHSWPYWERELHRAMPLLLKALGSGG
jgi:diacylglycerol O-acyltransferase / trehalose O-mycolyltransferase